jgi:hypothetical protein
VPHVSGLLRQGAGLTEAGLGRLRVTQCPINSAQSQQSFGEKARVAQVPIEPHGLDEMRARFLRSVEVIHEEGAELELCACAS